VGWDNGKFSYKCFQVDLVNHEGFQTITLMVLEAFVLHHLDKNLYSQICQNCQFQLWFKI